MANYTNTASTAQLASSLAVAATSCVVQNYSGFPAASYWAMIDRGTASAELVLVAAVAGTTLTITRAQGGTADTSHGAGATFEHVAPAAHFFDAELHQVATTGVHGVTGSVVGTGGSQTLTDKMIQGGFKAQHSYTNPAGLTASFESVADNANARDGFVHRNTGGDASRRAFLAEQSGTPRVEVFNDGRVKLNASASPGLENDGTTQLDGALTVNGAADFNSTANFDGAVTTNSTLDVNGATTLDGAVTASSTVSVKTLETQATAGGDTATRLTVRTRGGTKAIEVFDEVPSSIFAVDGEGDVTGVTLTAIGAVSGATVAATGAATAYGGRVPVTVSSLASVTSPTAGQLAFLTTDNLLYRWSGTAWLPIFTATVSDTQNTSGTTTSTTYTPTLTGGTTCGVAFTAPASGKVEIRSTLQMAHSASVYTYCTIRVKTGATIGSGTDVIAVSDDDANIRHGAGANRHTTSKLLAGLTPGDAYNVQQLFKVDSGTGTFLRKELTVVPQLA